MAEPRAQHGGSRPVRDPRPGLPSRHTALAHLDGRTRAAKLMVEVEAALVEHVGGRPTAPQALVIRSVALLCLRLDAACEKVIADRTTEHTDRHLATLCNAVRLGCARLGMVKVRTRAPDPLGWFT